MSLHACAVGELYSVGPLVIGDSGDLFALNALTADTLVHVRLPASVCALFDDPLDCNDHRGCVFCTNGTQCRAAGDELPDGSVDRFTYLKLLLPAVDAVTIQYNTIQLNQKRGMALNRAMECIT